MAVSLRDLQQRGNGKGRQPRPQKAKTYQFRTWKTLNLTDARASIEDSELSWCENALPIGNGAIQILNGPGASIATIAQGIASLWGVPFSSGGVFVSINSDGSISIITDAAFPGNVVELASTLEALWIVGQGGIEQLANVTASGVAPNVITSFSITNIVSDLGSNAPNSVIPYFRALALFAPFGPWVLSGVTPQPLTEKLDGLIPQLTLTPDVPAAVAVVQNLLCLLFLVTYTGTQAQAGAGPIPMVIGFTKGKGFLPRQGVTLKWITTLIVNGEAQGWGADTAGHIFQLFGASNATPVPYKVPTKLFDFGLATTAKACYKLGFEFQAPN